MGDQVIYLEKFIESTAHLPPEVQRILRTIKDLDERSEDLGLQIHDNLEGLLSHRPTVAAVRPELAGPGDEDAVLMAERVDTDTRLVVQFAEEKVQLAFKGYALLDEHLSSLDADIAALSDELRAAGALDEAVGGGGDAYGGSAYDLTALDGGGSVAPPSGRRGAGAGRRESSFADLESLASGGALSGRTASQMPLGTPLDLYGSSAMPGAATPSLYGAHGTTPGGGHAGGRRAGVASRASSEVDLGAADLHAGALGGRRPPSAGGTRRAAGSTGPAGGRGPADGAYQSKRRAASAAVHAAAAAVAAMDEDDQAGGAGGHHDPAAARLGAGGRGDGGIPGGGGGGGRPGGLPHSLAASQQLQHQLQHQHSHGGAGGGAASDRPAQGAGAGEDGGYPPAFVSPPLPPGFEHSAEQPQAPGRLLAHGDVGPGLVGLRAELFWPEENLWYIVDIYSVDIVRRKATIFYTTGESEELDLDEICKEGHLSLIDQ